MANLTGQVQSEEAARNAGTGKVDMKLEVVVIAVSDVDRAKEFYRKLGWRLDADFAFDNGIRVVQFTPPGSGCSVQFGKKLTSATPGAGSGFLIVSDIEAARGELVAAGIEVGAFFHIGKEGRVTGLDPERKSYGSRATFSDPDGNVWLLQEVTARLPGRVASNTTYTSVGDLSQALRRAERAHGEHEKRIGAADPNWADWYAEYLVREQSGPDLPQ
jgi:catechol 2,3-dioxygenase-like lactoylglutathione lyase family enzyme